MLLFVYQCKCFINQEWKLWGECKFFLTWASQFWTNVLHPPELSPSRDWPVPWCVGTAVLTWYMCYCYTKILFPEVLHTAGKSICSEQPAAAWQVTVGLGSTWPLTLLQRLPLFKKELTEAIELGSRSVCCWCFVKHMGAERLRGTMALVPSAGQGCVCVWWAGCCPQWWLACCKNCFVGKITFFFFHSGSWFQFQVFLMHLSFPGKSDKMQREVSADYVVALCSELCCCLPLKADVFWIFRGVAGVPHVPAGFWLFP